MVIEFFSPSLRKLWKEWELRLIILLSLTCQITLMLLGNRRRYTKSPLLQIALWCAYTAAGSFAAFALGVISCVLNDATRDTGPLDASRELEAFWAPFFLLHLGGVDTITAYSVDDNELWLRQLLNFVVQTWIVIYILLVAWRGSNFSILSILMLVAGIINHGERIYALWCASYRQRKVRASFPETRLLVHPDEEDRARATSAVIECLFADVPEEIWKPAAAPVKIVSDKDAVEYVELGLALMYDSLYTKTKASYSSWGVAMRCICFLLTCISLVLFCVLNNKEKYSKINVSINFALLTMAFLKELHGAFVLLTSYTTLFSLTYFTASDTNVNYGVTRELLKRIITTAFSWLRSPKWSNSMGQCSLLNNFLNEEPKGRLGILWKKEEKLYGTFHAVPVPDDMKGWMYNSCTSTTGTRSGVVSVIKWNEIHGREALPGLDSYDFWTIILVWHVVTEICYSLDREHFHGGVGTGQSQDIHLMRYKISKYISRYMMHLVMTNPEMLSSGWEHYQRRFSRLLIDVKKLCTATVTDWNSELEGGALDETREVRIRACGNFEDRCNDINGNSPNSDILLNCARLLEVLKRGTRGTKEENETELKERWKLLSGVWMEVLTYAAAQCTANQHARFLSQGGELLTFVWVLCNVALIKTEFLLLKV